MCAFLLQNSALWGSKQIHCVICEMGLLAPLIKAAMCKSLQCNGAIMYLPSALTISVYIVRLFLAFVIFSRVPQFSQSISLETLSFYPIRITRYLNRACMTTALQWRNNERDGVSNHRRHNCLLNRLFRRSSKKKTKLRITGLGEGNPSATGGFPSQRASDDENVSIWWRHQRMTSSNLMT